MSHTLDTDYTHRDSLNVPHTEIVSMSPHTLYTYYTEIVSMSHTLDTDYTQRLSQCPTYWTQTTHTQIVSMSHTLDTDYTHRDSLNVPHTEIVSMSPHTLYSVHLLRRDSLNVPHTEIVSMSPHTLYTYYTEIVSMSHTLDTGYTQR